MSEGTLSTSTPTSTLTPLPRLINTNELANLNNQCRFVSNWLNETVKIFMQVFFVVAFLSVFFFTYITSVEQEIFVAQVDIVVDDLYNQLAQNIDLFLPQQGQTLLKQQLKTYLQAMKIAPTDDSSIINQNNQIIATTKNLVIVIGVIVLGIIVSLIVLGFCTHLPFQITENIIVLVCMGLTEFTFLNLVTKNYIASNPNHIKMYFLQQVSAYAASKQ